MAVQPTGARSFLHRKVTSRVVREHARHVLPVGRLDRSSTFMSRSVDLSDSDSPRHNPAVNIMNGAGRPACLI